MMKILKVPEGTRSLTREIIEDLLKGKSSSFVDLEKIELPSSLEYLSPKLFRGHQNLREVVFHKDCNPEELSKQLFHNCKNLERVVLPEKLSLIRYGCFEGCSKLSDVVWPKVKVFLGGNTFKGTGLRELKEVTFKELGLNNFSDSALREVNVKLTANNLDSITKVNNKTFSNCKDLKTVTIKSNKPILIDSRVFENCKALETIIFESPVWVLGIRLFEECCNLKQMIVGPEIKYIDEPVSMKFIQNVDAELLVDDLLISVQDLVRAMRLVNVNQHNPSIEHLPYMEILGDGLRRLYPEQFVVKEMIFNEDYDLEETSLF